MIDPMIEEILEALYMREFEGKADLLAEMSADVVRNASSCGFVELDGESPRLTEKGKLAGRDVVRRHRLAECLLRDVLNSEPTYMEEDACRFEHVLQNGLDDKVCTLLGHPTQCPHGHAIPEGECCRKAKADRIPEVRPLCDAQPGEQGTISFLSARTNRELQKLMVMGVLPGTAIELIMRFPSYVFQVGHSQFTVDRELASTINVHWKL